MSEQVKEMFTQISGKYDLLNDILSLGTHRIWKRSAVKMMKIEEGNYSLDLATGTGDLAKIISEKVGPEGNVEALDISQGMIDFAINRLRDIKNINLKVGDALSLPYDDNTFDSVVISFGIRNTDDPQKTVDEMTRVLKEGGRLVVMEFGMPDEDSIFSKIYRLYSKHIIPNIGRFLVKSDEPYEYLPRTISEFPNGFEFLRFFYKNNNLNNLDMKKLFGGISYIYSGQKK